MQLQNLNSIFQGGKDENKNAESVVLCLRRDELLASGIRYPIFAPHTATWIIVHGNTLLCQIVCDCLLIDIIVSILRFRTYVHVLSVDHAYS